MIRMNNQVNNWFRSVRRMMLWDKPEPKLDRSHGYIPFNTNVKRPKQSNSSSFKQNKRRGL